ncbi:hypothetical protein Tco_1515195 [Tanacetum coccineum]
MRKGSKASKLESLKQAKQEVRGEGSSAAHNKYYEFKNISATDSDATQDSSRSDSNEERDNEIDDSDMDLSEDERKGDDDVAGFGVLILLNETPVHELPDIMSHLVYTDAHTTSVVHNSEGNPKIISYKSCASEKLEALTFINISKVMDKVVHAKLLTEMKKLLPTHVPKDIVNYVNPRLNNSVCEVMRNNQISLFTKPSTNIDDLLDMELKLRLLNRIHLNKSNTTHPTHQKLYDTLYDSVTLN